MVTTEKYLCHAEPFALRYFTFSRRLIHSISFFPLVTYTDAAPSDFPLLAPYTSANTLKILSALLLI